VVIRLLALFDDLSALLASFDEAKPKVQNPGESLFYNLCLWLKSSWFSEINWRLCPICCHFWLVWLRSINDRLYTDTIQQLPLLGCVVLWYKHTQRSRFYSCYVMPQQHCSFNCMLYLNTSCSCSCDVQYCSSMPPCVQGFILPCHRLCVSNSEVSVGGSSAPHWDRQLLSKEACLCSYVSALSPVDSSPGFVQHVQLNLLPFVGTCTSNKSPYHQNNPQIISHKGMLHYTAVFLATMNDPGLTVTQSHL